MKKSLYFDCSSGISGDMSVAALLDLGADQEVLTDTLASLPLTGYEIEISKVIKSGISACDFHVKMEHNPDHDMEYLHGTQKYSHEGHKHDTIHQHHHEHRGLADVLAILRAGSMSPEALALAEKIFVILAEAEAKAHNLPIDQVHFHEVGAIDSIIDIAAFAICFDNLGYRQVIIPSLCEGQGMIRCQHGLLPVPVPATTNILSLYHLPLSVLPVQGELITPTGAAIAAAVMTDRKLPDIFSISGIGIGAGKRQYQVPGLLRIMQIEF